MTIARYISDARGVRLAAGLLLLLGVLLGARTLVALLVNLPAILRDGHDSWETMIAALGVLHGPDPTDLYQKLFFQSGVKFQYPPSSILLLEGLRGWLPLSYVTLNSLNCLMFLVNAGLLAALAAMAFNRTVGAPGRDGGIAPGIAAVVGFASAFAFFPLLRAFEIGQIQIWIDAAVSGACLLFLLNRKLAMGAVIAAVAAIKPQLGLLLLWAVVWREWAFVKGFLALGVPIAALSIGLYGWQNHLGYLQVLSFISQHGESFFANHSINGILNRLLFNGPILTFDSNAFAPYHPFVYWGTLVSGAALMLLPLALRFAVPKRAANVFDFGIACVCFTMAAPVAWEHHYGILLPFLVLSLAAILNDTTAAARPAQLLVLSAAWFLTASRIPFLAVTAGTSANFVFAHIFFGAALLLFVMWRAANARHQIAYPGSASTIRPPDVGEAKGI